MTIQPANSAPSRIAARRRVIPTIGSAARSGSPDEPEPIADEVVAWSRRRLPGSAEAVTARLLDDEALLLDALEFALEPGDLAPPRGVVGDHRLGSAGRGRGLADLAGEQDDDPAGQQRPEQDRGSPAGDPDDRQRRQVGFAGRAGADRGRGRRVGLVGGVIDRCLEEPAKHPGEGSYAQLRLSTELAHAVVTGDLSQTARRVC